MVYKYTDYCHKTNNNKSTKKPSMPRLLLLALILCVGVRESTGFDVSCSYQPFSVKGIWPTLGVPGRQTQIVYRTSSPNRKDIPGSTRLSASPDPDNDNKGTEPSKPLLDRFLSPRIDDIGLPLADALVAQIVAPSFQVFWIGISHAPLPTWLRPLSNSMWDTRGSLVAPTLIHGASLACCWLAGALAAKAFESDAFNVSGGRGYGTVIARTIKGGAFATGLLILSTQTDLLIEFGQYVQLGDSEETDFRLLTAGVEVINDIIFEAVALFSWRIYRASLTAERDTP